MQHEKSDKPSALQSKLAGLDGLPGEPAFDTAAVWNRLEHRMEHRPAYQRKYRLWAAACLLLLAGAAALFAYQSQERQQVQQPARAVLPPVAKSSSSVKTAVPAAVQPVLRKQPATVKRNRPASVPLAKERQHRPEAVEQSTAVTIPPTAEAQLPAAELPSTNKVALVEKAPPRKLKVVHLNEMDRPEQTTLPAPSGSLLAARAAVPARRDGRAPISFSRNTSDDLIKINISPTN